MTPFRIIIIAICGVLSVAALLVFSGVLPGFRPKPVGVAGNIVMWGYLPKASMENYISTLNKANEKLFNITYVTKSRETIEAELIDALAGGKGPDLVLLPHEALLHQEDKFELIPYTSYTEATFNQNFVPGAQILKRSEGVLGLPVAVDPLVLYYNDSLLVQSNVVVPPKFWTEIANPAFDGLLKKVTRVDERNNISQSLIALGVFDNVNHAKDILSLLIMQSGDPVVGGVPGNLRNGMGQASVAALNFFTQFSNPAKEQYTWSSAMSNSGDAFGVGKVALYLGLASDLAKFNKINPHLNPRVVVVPQRDQSTAQTFGRFHVLAITKASARKSAAVSAIGTLTNQVGSQFFSEALGLPPVRRDLLAAGSGDPNQNVFYRSAILAKAWFDVNPSASLGTFRDMVQNVLSGVQNPSDAVGQASNQLLLNQ